MKEDQSLIGLMVNRLDSQLARSMVMTDLGCPDLYLHFEIFQGQASECILLNIIFKYFEKVLGFENLQSNYGAQS